jgi:hypothetical protein
VDKEHLGALLLDVNVMPYHEANDIHGERHRSEHGECEEVREQERIHLVIHFGQDHEERSFPTNDEKPAKSNKGNALIHVAYRHHGHRTSWTSTS